MEKQQTTPEYYPLTVKALVAACNQKSNRDPVMELAEADVRGALDRLRDDVLAWAVEGARVERWEHNLDRRLQLDPAGKALVTVLLLRGPQTPGELRMRTERMHAFASLAEVEDALVRLAANPELFVVEMRREPGRKESRWMHFAAGDVAAVAPPRAPSPAVLGASLAERLATLEARVAELAEQLERLRAALGDQN